MASLSINALMLYFMLVEAGLILILLIPIRFLNRITIRICRALFQTRYSQYVYAFFTTVAILVTVNLYSAFHRYSSMKLAKDENGRLAAPDVFYKAQRDLYLNGVTLYLWVVITLLISMHERYARAEERQRRQAEEKKNQ
mmetsp:Transcript_11008/g.20251  ORF Transcript_11008/g.20251 Transcript_11008/m.20251 type:complete len:140 (+) Transcript_11008:109-528(+)